MLNRNPNLICDPEIKTEVIEDFTLQSGTVIPKAKLGYCVFGDLKKPILVLHTAVSGNPKAFSTQKSGYGDGWWNRHLGEGKLFDLSKNCVICISHFGGNGPSSTAEELSNWLDDLSIIDTCHLAANVLDKLGIKKIHAAIGVSMGGAVAREWIFQDIIDVSGTVEIFANFGNNFYGATAKNYCHIQIDLLKSDGSNLNEIRTRIHENCKPMTLETYAFARAYEHIMEEFQTLYSDFSDDNVLRVTRMIGFFRFVSPHFFQSKWDEFYNESFSELEADNDLIAYCDNLGDSFIKTFKRSSLASLRYMDAKPLPYDENKIAKRLVERDISTLGLIVRGDRLYDPSLQLQYYQGILSALSINDNESLRIHLCSNQLRGHDHFLSPEFSKEAQVVKTFLEGIG